MPDLGEDIGSSRDQQLQSFLDRLADVEKGATIKWFTTTEELAGFVAQDVAAWQVEKIRQGRFGAETLYAGVPAMPVHFIGRECIVKQVVRALRSESARVAWGR